MNLIGGTKPRAWVLPPYQRFDGEDACGPQVDLRLIEQDELRTRHGVSQLLLQQEFLMDLGVQFRRIKPKIVAAGFLDAVHRGIGVGEQRVGVCAVTGIVRDPHAGGYAEFMSVEINRLGDGRG